MQSVVENFNTLFDDDDDDEEETPRSIPAYRQGSGYRMGTSIPPPHHPRHFHHQPMQQLHLPPSPQRSMPPMMAGMPPPQVPLLREAAAAAAAPAAAASERVIHDPVVPVKVRIERVPPPRIEAKEFPYHDAAYGPWFRFNQPDRDDRDMRFIEVEPDDTQPLGRLWRRHKADEIRERRQKQWEAKFEEMRHPKVYGLFHPDHGPATVCYQNLDGGSLLSWLAA